MIFRGDAVMKNLFLEINLNESIIFSNAHSFNIQNIFAWIEFRGFSGFDESNVQGYYVSSLSSFCQYLLTLK